ncbi:hypothetical protein BBJ28_00004160 [Nothophytophthora sp. Chile5]|nr:hypothetical protein BBJ28_00004160 [Nothophytophthora sp. Chile5]
MARMTKSALSRLCRRLFRAYSATPAMTAAAPTTATTATPAKLAVARAAALAWGVTPRASLASTLLDTAWWEYAWSDTVSLGVVLSDTALGVVLLGMGLLVSGTVSVAQSSEAPWLEVQSSEALLSVAHTLAEPWWVALSLAE